MNWPGRLSWVALGGMLGLGILGPQAGEAQVRRIYGNIRSSFAFEDTRVGDSSSQRSDIRQDHSLTVEGLVLDPRLATFDLTGTFGSTDPLLGEVEESRVVSGGVNLNVFPTSRVPLTLRHFQSHGWNGTTSDVTSSSVDWRVSHPLYPSLTFRFDRTAVETKGRFPSDTTFLNGRVESSYRRENIDVQADGGVLYTADALRDTTQISQFAGLTATYRPTPGTHLDGRASYFQTGDNLTSGIAATFISRPDPTLTRTANAGFRVTQGDGSSLYGLDAGGSLSKTYLLSPAFQAYLTGLTSAASDLVAEGTQGGFLSLTAGGIGGVTYSGFRYITAALDTGLTGLYEEDTDRGFGVRASAHLGLTGKNLGPLSATGDYTYRIERGVVNGSDHTLSLRGSYLVPIRPTLTFEALADAGIFLQEGGEISTGSRSVVSASGGGRAIFSGIPRVTWSLESRYRVTRSGAFDTNTVLTSSTLTYSPFARLQAVLTGTREDTLNTRESRTSVLADLRYQIGVTTLSLNYTFDLLSGRGESPMLHRVILSLTRPFGLGLR